MRVEGSWAGRRAAAFGLAVLLSALLLGLVPGARGERGSQDTPSAELPGGDTISTRHQVRVDDRVVHEHQTHVGKYGGERRFPNEWVEFPDIGMR